MNFFRSLSNSKNFSLRFFNILKQKTGVAIMSVLLFFMVISMFIGVLSFTSVNNARVSNSNSQSMAAFYAAEAGIQRVVYSIQQVYENVAFNKVEVENELKRIRDYFIEHPIIALESNGGYNVHAYVTFENYVIDTSSSRISMTVSSIGTVESKSRRLIKDIYIDFDSVGNFSMPYAILSNSTISSSGTISTNLSGVQAIVKTRMSNGGVSVGNNVLVERQPSIELPLIDFQPIRRDANAVRSGFSNRPSHDNLSSALVGNNTLSTGNYYIDRLNFATLGVNQINIPNGHVFIVTNQITLGSVNFTGSGTVTIYVKPGFNSFIPTGGTDFGPRINEHRLVVYIDTISASNNTRYHINFPNSTTMRGYFMFENARVQFQNFSDVWGGIFTGATNTGNADAISIHNQANLRGLSLLVAPNGTVNLNNQSSMRGAVIANSFTQGNGSTLIFDPNLPTFIPFTITSPSPIGIGSGTSRNRSLTISPTIER